MQLNPLPHNRLNQLKNEDQLNRSGLARAYLQREDVSRSTVPWPVVAATPAGPVVQVEEARMSTVFPDELGGLGAEVTTGWSNGVEFLSIVGIGAVLTGPHVGGVQLEQDALRHRSDNVQQTCPEPPPIPASPPGIDLGRRLEVRSQKSPKSGEREDLESPLDHSTSILRRMVLMALAATWPQRPLTRGQSGSGICHHGFLLIPAVLDTRPSEALATALQS